MKKLLAGFSAIFICAAMLLNVLAVIFTVYAEETEITADSNSLVNISAKSAILMEAKTGQVIFEKNADELVHPASITKIMTLLLIFDALEEGRIKLEDEVTVSEHAASMGGSQVYLEAGEKQTVNTMIKCISMASANDACVAMSEYISGTEEAFVARMNERAKELGMTGTNFINCCGLDAEGHMSTARDVAIMSRELINMYPQIHDYSTVWMDTITHVTRRGESEFTLTNTNKLIKQYEWATGLKTGSTGLAKCCLSATARKDGIDLIAVVMAAENSKLRFSETISLLNYGFSSCYIYKDEEMPELPMLEVKNGKESTVELNYESDFSYLFTEKTDFSRIKKILQVPDNVTAEIKKGTVVGQIKYFYNDDCIGSVNVVAAKDIDKMNFADALKMVIEKYFVIN